MSTLIMKFGGTSVGSAVAMRATADIVRAAQANWPRVVVISASLMPC
jgi:aspartokinase